MEWSAKEFHLLKAVLSENVIGVGGEEEGVRSK